MASSLIFHRVFQLAVTTCFLFLLLIYCMKYVWFMCALHFSSTKNFDRERKNNNFETNNRSNRSIAFGTFQFMSLFKCNRMHFQTISPSCSMLLFLRFPFSLTRRVIWLHLKSILNEHTRNRESVSKIERIRCAGIHVSLHLRKNERENLNHSKCSVCTFVTPNRHRFQA